MRQLAVAATFFYQYAVIHFFENQVNQQALNSDTLKRYKSCGIQQVFRSIVPKKP